MTPSAIVTTEINADAIGIALQQHQQAILASLLVSAWMVEARDPYTGGHLWRVSQFAMILARKAGLPEAEV